MWSRCGTQILVDRREHLPALAREDLWVELALVSGVLACSPDSHKVGADAEVDDGWGQEGCLQEQKVAGEGKDALPISPPVRAIRAKRPSTSYQ